MSGSATGPSKKDMDDIPYNPNLRPRFAPNSNLNQESSGSKQAKHKGTAGVSGGPGEGGVISKFKKKEKKKQKKRKGEGKDDVGREEVKGSKCTLL